MTLTAAASILLSAIAAGTGIYTVAVHLLGKRAVVTLGEQSVSGDEIRHEIFVSNRSGYPMKVRRFVFRRADGQEVGKHHNQTLVPGTHEIFPLKVPTVAPPKRVTMEFSYGASRWVWKRKIRLR